MARSDPAKKHVVVLGAGLAGLSCAYELATRGLAVTVLEREPHAGGMASSFLDERDGERWTYDFGPHRFHSTDEELLQHVKHVLGGNHLEANRLSRIMLFNRFFDYPLKAGNVLANLPRRILVRAFLDYTWIRLLVRLGRSRYRDDNFEGWVTNRFGRTLYKLFFGVYTEKAWKMAPSQISGDWASQRISLLSLGDAVKQALFPPPEAKLPREEVSRFLYPSVGGIGEIARAYVRHIEANGGKVLAGAPAVKVLRDGPRVTGIKCGGRGGRVVEGDHYISTIPITALAKAVSPPAPEPVRAAIRGLEYVSIIFVYVRLRKAHVSPDNWVYIPEPHVAIHRIAEFKNFSPNCAPEDKTMVCAEITCRLGDEHWRASDDELSALAVSDLERIGLIASDEVLETFVKKIPFAYPVYDLRYKENLAPILAFVHSLENIQTGGRQGLFRYNNMDQSIEMGRRMAWGVLAEQDAAHELVATGSEYFG